MTLINGLMSPLSARGVTDLDPSCGQVAPEWIVFGLRYDFPELYSIEVSRKQARFASLTAN